MLYNKNEINPTSVVFMFVDGHIVQHMDYEKTSNQVSTDGIVPGLYILSILEDGVVVLTEKVVIR